MSECTCHKNYTLDTLIPKVGVITDIRQETPDSVWKLRRVESFSSICQDSVPWSVYRESVKVCFPLLLLRL